MIAWSPDSSTLFYARYGAGMSYRVGDRLTVDSEVSDGDLGSAGRLGTNYLFSDATSLYLNYALENERTDNGLRNQRGNLVAGVSPAIPGAQWLADDEGRLLLKIEEHGLDNVRIACEDAVDLLRHRVPDNSLAGVRIYFPDPWHKKRHHKRRLVQPQFVELLARRMSAGAILHIATDWAPYAAQMRDVLAGSPDFENLSPTGDFSPRPEWRPPSRYEQRGERLGHDVFDLVCRRVVESGAN